MVKFLLIHVSKQISFSKYRLFSDDVSSSEKNRRVTDGVVKFKFLIHVSDKNLVSLTIL